MYTHSTRKRSHYTIVITTAAATRCISSTPSRPHCARTRPHLYRDAATRPHPHPSIHSTSPNNTMTIRTTIMIMTTRLLTMTVAHTSYSPYHSHVHQERSSILVSMTILTSTTIITVTTLIITTTRIEAEVEATQHVVEAHFAVVHALVTATTTYAVCVRSTMMMPTLTRVCRCCCSHRRHSHHPHPSHPPSIRPHHPITTCMWTRRHLTPTILATPSTQTLHSPHMHRCLPNTPTPVNDATISVATHSRRRALSTTTLPSLTYHASSMDTAATRTMRLAYPHHHHHPHHHHYHRR